MRYQKVTTALFHIMYIYICMYVYSVIDSVKYKGQKYFTLYFSKPFLSSDRQGISIINILLWERRMSGKLLLKVENRPRLSPFLFHGQQKNHYESCLQVYTYVGRRSFELVSFTLFTNCCSSQLQTVASSSILIHIR